MFKKGDRVKYTGKGRYPNRLVIGKIGTIKSEQDGNNIRVEWDDLSQESTYPSLTNIEKLDDEPTLDRLMREYKDARSAHVRAKEQQAAAQRGVHLFATELQKARDALLAEIDKSTAPKENSNA